MKKIMLAAMAALAITGCSQNEEFDAPSQNTEIQVGTIVKAATKAAVTNNTNFLDFKLYSYIVDATSISTTGLGGAYMNGIKYTRVDGTQPWGTTDTGKYYWPIEAKMQCFAYPSDITDFTVPTTGGGYPSFSFTIGTNGADQKDLVVAYAADVTKPASGNVLQLDFKHILTRVNFSYSKEDPTYVYTVKTITIKDVEGGTATYTYNNGIGTWTDGSEKKIDYVYSINSNPVETAGVFALDVENGSLMLLPQSVAGKTIDINYEVTKNKVKYFSGTKTVTLPEGAIWGAGNNIRYKLTLPVGGEGIVIGTDVKDWNGETTPASPIN